ncbi:MAG TPA: pyridoxamine 5'-phosphate oxidase family protein [Dehalococcoidia bacterium]|nr:pyridoxamine 5'-phosphate oxidase family protein [Dehalococcoidia bacterium]
MSNQPSSATSARFPAEYGQKPGQDPDLLPWSHIEERLRSALNYWLASIAPSGRPHLRAVDGVWVEGALCFGGSPETRWVRNLEINPAVSISLPSDAEAIILEGNVEHITDASHPLEAAADAASREKYPQYFTGDTDPPFHPFWALRPSVAYAWTLADFPNRATRWTFDQP